MTTSDCADVMWIGRSFYMLAAATGNSCLLTVVLFLINYYRSSIFIYKALTVLFLLCDLRIVLLSTVTIVLLKTNNKNCFL